MIPTPQDVALILEPLAAPVHEALGLGLTYSDEVMLGFDPFFQSHCVRYRAKQTLGAMDDDRWSLRDRVPNSGIHLIVDGLHVIRLLRSLNDSVPHPGHGRTRRAAWTGVRTDGVQLQLDLDDRMTCPPLSLLLDWHVECGEMVVHASLPVAAWGYGRAPRLHWRVRLQDPGVGGTMAFEPADDGGQPFVGFEVAAEELSG